MSTDMKKRIKEFEEHLRTERRLSGHTITSYQRDLEKLAIWCAESELLLENITTHDIRACLSYLHKNGLRGKSIDRKSVVEGLRVRARCERRW